MKHKEQVWEKDQYYSEVDLLDFTMLAGFYGLPSRVASPLTSSRISRGDARCRRKRVGDDDQRV